MKEGFCKCDKIRYIWYDGVKPTWVCRDCGHGITWEGEE